MILSLYETKDSPQRRRERREGSEKDLLLTPEDTENAQRPQRMRRHLQRRREKVYCEAGWFSASNASTRALISAFSWPLKSPLAALAKPAWMLLTRPSRPMKTVVGHEFKLTSCGIFLFTSSGSPATSTV